ncbi:unnamed protein product [Ostreobium quekettii]|uniref:C-type lectin n=1 Tax=Ostreobium quekettii TaxID=121088 RepID=A0A8S1IPM9_9CHLO|nr:unnamed protein product [Ostreobium quekettii]
MDEVFSEARDEFGIRAWTYIATGDGVMRTWPGHAMERGDDVPPGEGNAELGNCKPYEPRLRPWYVAATSGPKDVVLVIDTSGSMLTTDGEKFGDFRSRWDITKDAILALLNTFGTSDFVNIVAFNSDARALYTNKLVQANEEQIALLKEALENIEPLGGTDFRLAMEVAFDLLINAADRTLEDEEPTSSDCEKVILFLTDGKDCTLTNSRCSMPVDENETGVDSVLNFIEEKQTKLASLESQRAHIFTFSLGFEADDELPKEMACANEGIWKRIIHSDDPLVKMNAYTSYLASRRAQSDVIWSRTYDDAFGLGTVITAAKPVYGPATAVGEQGPLIGVVGHDVRLSDFNERAPGFQETIGRFISRGNECLPVEFSSCDLQLLRGEQAQCPEVFDDANCYFFEGTGNYYMAPKTPLLDFAGAEEYCQERGGTLAEIDEDLEDELLAGIASNAGSWLGLRYSDNDSQWVWTNSGRVEPQGSNLWAVLIDPPTRRNRLMCATIDRRGVQQNVHPEDCSVKRRFLCEFVGPYPPTGCGESDTIVVDDDYEYNVRPLSTCRPGGESGRDATAIGVAVESLTNERVICPLGQPKSTFDVRCCDECK